MYIMKVLGLEEFGHWYYAEYPSNMNFGDTPQEVSKEFYEYIKPRICLWASPEWLWNNDNGNGFDTGPWKTVQTRQWMQELGVTKHIVEKDGITKICF